MAVTLYNKNRGRRIQDVLPDVDVRTLRMPHVAPNNYIGHRITLAGPNGRLGCDCGETFSTAVQLETHQHPYRHPAR